MNTPISLAALLERFFTQRLMQQRQASPHTISSYRDTFHQFLKFTEQRLHKEPSRLVFQEIEAAGRFGRGVQQPVVLHGFCLGGGTGEVSGSAEDCRVVEAQAKRAPDLDNLRGCLPHRVERCWCGP